MVGEDKTFGQVVAQIAEFLKGLTPRQRILLGGGAALVAITLFVFVRLITTPDFKTLYSGLDPREAESLAARLKARNIPSHISADRSSISVPADKVDASRLEVASEGVPRNGRMGFELFDKSNWAGSDFSEKVNFQRALEGELERTIQTLSHVEAARVHLVLATDSVFAEHQREAKASVILKLRRGGLSPEEQATIARLVASAVDQLRPENVMVVDADSGRPLRPSLPSGDASELEEKLAARLVHTLEPVLGPDRVRASVRVEYDTSSSEESKEEYDPNGTVALTMNRREEQSGGVRLDGAPGTASDFPLSQGVRPERLPDARHSSRSEESTYAVSRTVRHVTEPPGRVKRISAALLVDDAIEPKAGDKSAGEVRRKRTPEEMKQIEQLARAALALDSERGDVLAVENISFQDITPPAPPPPTSITRLRTELNRWADLLRYGLIALLVVAVYAVLLRPVQRQVLQTFRQLPSQFASAPVKEAGGTGTGNLAAGAPTLEFAEPSPDSTRLASLKQQVTEKVKTQPATSTRLVQSWLERDEN